MIINKFKYYFSSVPIYSSVDKNNFLNYNFFQFNKYTFMNKVRDE